MRITLTTTGRRSGEPRSVPLYAWPDGDDGLILVGSQAGKDTDPAWVHNLRAHPRATVTRGKRTEPWASSEVPDGPERERLWALVTAAFPHYAVYQRRTSRRIPLFVLTRGADPSRGPAGPTR